MAIPVLQSPSEGPTDRVPLLMEESISQNAHEHIVNIPQTGVASTSTSNGDDFTDSDELHQEDRTSSSLQAPSTQSFLLSPTVSNSRNSSVTRRGDTYGRRHRSPLNSGFWISVELVVNLSQITAAVIVLSLSRDEHPRAPLFTWIMGYTAGCIASLPHLYWRYIHRSGQGPDQDSAHLRRNSSRNNHIESNSYTTITVTQGEGQQDAALSSRFGRNLITFSPRLNAFVDHLKMALDCFFAVWFVVGNVWIFGGHSSAADAPNLYRLCIVFLAFSCIGYAMPFILCATICCCLPCIISILGFREDMNQTRGATPESINALPSYKFKSKRGSCTGEENEGNSESIGEGGILAAGTDKERAISAEDAVCCICLAKYVDNDELRELPCTHFFHTECVDKWLKINASCPLCKFEVGESAGATSGSNSGGHNDDRRVGSGGDLQETQ
ncbi:putative transcription factor C2H2 family [Dioscorea sansibarensis]